MRHGLFLFLCVFVLSETGSIALAQKASAAELIRQFDSEDEEGRQAAIDALAKMGKKASDELEDALKSKSTPQEVRIGVIEVLGKMGRAGVRVLDSFLSRQATTATIGSKHATVSGIGTLGAEAAWTTPLLIDVIDSKEAPPIRASAVLSLGLVGEDTRKNRKVLEKLTKDEDTVMVMSSACALWWLTGEPELAYPLLLKGLEERQNTMALERAIYGLGEMGAHASEAKPILLGMRDEVLEQTTFVIGDAVRKIEGKLAPDGPRRKAEEGEEPTSS